MERDYSLRTNDNPERPTFSLNGKSNIVFDIGLGVVRSHEMQATLTQESQNVTVRLPITATLKLLDPEIIEQRARDVAAVKATAEAARKAVEDADAAMTPAARVEYYLSEINKNSSSGTGRPWATKLRDMQPTAEQHDAVVQTMTAIGLDPDSWVRKEAMEVMERWATAEDIPRLLQLAAVSDNSGHSVQGPALRSLGKLKAEVAIDLMVDKLKELRSRKDAAEEKVLALLTVDDTFTRYAVFDILSAIGTEVSVTALKEQNATDSRSSEKYHRDTTIGKIESRLVAEKIVKQLPANSTPDPTSRSSASAVHSRSVNPTSLDALRGVIQELRRASTVAAKISAIQQLERMVVNPQYQSAVEMELHKYINPNETALWPIIAGALSKWGTSASLDKLREMLQAEPDNDTLAVLIVPSLKRMDSRDASLVLLPLISNENVVVREQAVSALSSVGSHVEAELIELLASDMEQLQYDIVAILRATGSRESNASLMKIARDGSTDRLKQAARRALPEVLRRSR